MKKVINEDWSVGDKAILIPKNKVVEIVETDVAPSKGKIYKVRLVKWGEGRDGVKDGKWIYARKEDLKGMNESITDKVTLRQAIDSGNIEQTAEALKNCYKEMLEAGVVDEKTYAEKQEIINQGVADKENAADNINFELDEFYDLYEGIDEKQLSEDMMGKIAGSIGGGAIGSAVAGPAGGIVGRAIGGAAGDNLTETIDAPTIKVVDCEDCEDVEDAPVVKVINYDSEEEYKEANPDSDIIVNDEEELTEDTVKQGSKWVNKGKDGTHGKFDTKKAADAQRRAIWVNWNK